MRYLLATIVLGASLLSACGGRRSGPQPSAPRTVLEVDNRGFVDMTVYVINGGQRIRLGLATGSARTVLTIPTYVLRGARQLQFLADPVGSSRTSVSDEIYVAPGDTVTLIIPP